jgi:hypothetical protein
MIRYVFGHDAYVAEWMTAISNSRPMLYNMAIGIVEDTTGDLVGGIMFTGYNGSDAEVHFYGPGALTRGTVRLIFGLAVKHFDLNRLTVRTRKRHMARGVSKLGAVFEGTVKRLYGPSDGKHDAGRQYAFFRERMEEIAGLKERKRDVRLDQAA